MGRKETIFCILFSAQLVSKDQTLGIGNWVHSGEWFCWRIWYTCGQERGGERGREWSDEVTVKYGCDGFEAGESVGRPISGGRALLWTREFWKHVLLQQRSSGFLDCWVILDYVVGTDLAPLIPICLGVSWLAREGILLPYVMAIYSCLIADRQRVSFSRILEFMKFR